MSPVSHPSAKRPSSRWIAPVAAAAAFLLIGPVISAIGSAANADLASRTAAQLLVDVEKAHLSGMSGIVVEQANLGLPELPSSAVGGNAGLGALLTGSHTLRVWYGGAKQARVSLLNASDEIDLVHNGANLWQWSSSTNSADHWTLPAQSKSTHADAPLGAHSAMPLTPQQAADRALAAITPTTRVTNAGTTTVADRPAYLLELQPRSTQTLVSSVQIAIDGVTHVPTRVQVFAKGVSQPALSIGFSQFDPTMPSDSVFAFNPPPGTKVTQESLTLPTASKHATSARDSAPSSTGVVGTGWASVVVTRVPADLVPSASTSKNTANSTLRELLKMTSRVSGPWGSGYLVQGTVFSVLLTDTHQLVIGAVPPSALYAALAGRATK